MPQLPPRVFVTQQPKPNGKGWAPNLSPATNFGTIHFIYSGGDRPSTDPTAAMFIASEALEDFDANRDYILWPNGVDPFSIWAVLLVLAKKGVSQVRGLNWERRLSNGKRDPQNGFYTPVVFQLSQLNDIEQYSPSTEPVKVKVDVQHLLEKHNQRSNGDGNVKKDRRSK